jgi:uncharacterized paraquat-inducible protein A
MAYAIHVRCPCCGARIKAPAQLIGQTRDCPRCKTRLVVRMSTPEDLGPVLIEDDSPPLARPGLSRAG